MIDYAVGEPHLVGMGPVTFSTCLDLVPLYHFVWDTNGYYRDLGVSTNATRRQIREAYQAKKGWRSPRLTYVVKQLLDPEIRAKYDSTPLGDMFLDYYVETWFREARVRQVTTLRQAGYTDLAEELEDEDLFWEAPEEAPEEEVLDTTSNGRKDGPSTTEKWPWSYYLWQSTSQDTERLRRWQEHLISALGKRKESIELAVGFLGGTPNTWAVRPVGYRIVVFLNDGAQPTEALAEAASRVVMSNEEIQQWRHRSQTFDAARKPRSRLPSAAAGSQGPNISVSMMGRRRSSGS